MCVHVCAYMCMLIWWCAHPRGYKARGWHWDIFFNCWPGVPSLDYTSWLTSPRTHGASPFWDCYYRHTPQSISSALRTLFFNSLSLDMLISKYLLSVNNVASTHTHSSSFICLFLFSQVRFPGAYFTRSEDRNILELTKYPRNLYFCLSCFLYTLPKSGSKKL